jgi:hypothetical protein
MKGLRTFCMLSALLFACGCGPSESARRIRAFTQADCQTVQAAVEKLCASHVPLEAEEDDLMIGLLFGDQIPNELAYLKPEAVRIRRHFVDIYLYKTPSAEDSIWVRQGKDGVWTVETHEGSWKNEPKVLWTSAKDPNRVIESPSGLAPGRGSP